MRSFILASLLFAGSAQATSLLVSDQTYIADKYTYGAANYQQFSGHLDNHFNQVDVGNFNDLTVMLGYDAIWVTLRGSNNSSLSALEASNLSSYIATGGKVLLQGEQGGWNEWNESILNLVGATASGSVSSNTLNALGGHPLLTEVDQIEVGSAGNISNPGAGVFLFDLAAAAVWGNNVLGIMDVNLFEDTRIGTEDNTQFAMNSSRWLAAKVVLPIPAAVWLFGSALAGLIGFRRYRAA
jgi:hypothetical protein